MLVLTWSMFQAHVMSTERVKLLENDQFQSQPLLFTSCHIEGSIFLFIIHLWTFCINCRRKLTFILCGELHKFFCILVTWMWILQGSEIKIHMNGYQDQNRAIVWYHWIYLVDTYAFESWYHVQPFSYSINVSHGI